MKRSDSKIYKVLFQAKLETLDQMMQWIRKHAVEANFSSYEIRQIELSMEEALVNVIKHAKVSPAETIEIKCSVFPKVMVQYIIKDKGVAFNPLLQEPKIDLDSSLEERNEGGVGILLMLQYMDEVKYSREEPYNILTLIKKCTKD